MTQELASELIKENLTAIYGFAFARLYEKDKVEEYKGNYIPAPEAEYLEAEE